jgi:hypothetical protein
MTLRAHARFSEDRRDGTTKEIIKIPFPIREWIIELDKLDPRGTAFRYADGEAGTLRYAEYWVDFVHFKYAMKCVFECLDHAYLHLRRMRPTLA